MFLVINRNIEYDKRQTKIREKKTTIELYQTNYKSPTVTPTHTKKRKKRNKGRDLKHVLKKNNLNLIEPVSRGNGIHSQEHYEAAADGDDRCQPNKTRTDTAGGGDAFFASC